MGPVLPSMLLGEQSSISLKAFNEQLAGNTKHCNPVHASVLSHSLFMESFPSLTVVNVWDWAGSRRHSDEKLRFKAVSSDRLMSKGSLHSLPCPPVLPPKETLQTFKSADPFISSVYPVSHPTAAKEKGIQLNTPHISPDLIGSELPLGSTSLVLWVPNPKYIHQCHNQKRQLYSRMKKSFNGSQCSVKELICLPVCPIQKASKEKEKPKSVKKRFQQACLSLNNAGLTFSCQLDSASNQSPSGEEQGIDRGPSTEPSSETTENRVSLKERKKSPLMLRNRPVVLHTMQERAVKRVTMNALTFPYKLDSKTGVESIEWDRLRQQAYLWKRHNPLQHKDCSVSVYPPGDANVLLVDSPLCPVPSVKPHHPLQSPLSVGIWSYQKSSGPPMSQSKYFCHSTASEADTPSADCSSCTLVDHRIPDTNEKSVKEKNIKDIISPIDSLLPYQQFNQEHQDNASERSAVHVGHSFPGKSNHSSQSNSSRSFNTGTEEPWKENSSTEKEPEPKGYELCTPPPSLSSL